jgi:superoxide reductase
VIFTRRVYDKGDEVKGKTFLVDRMWPRGISKSDLKMDAWLKEVAPSKDLREKFHEKPERWGEFKQQYYRELDREPRTWEPVLQAARNGDVTLLYASKNRTHNNAVALKSYLDEKLKAVVIHNKTNNNQEEGIMKPFAELYQTADWKTEKHIPVIDCPEKVAADEMFEVKVNLGKEVAHPNTTAHHIRWISVYFLPEGARFPYQIGHFAFSAHGESTEGPDTSSVYTHQVSTSMKTGKPGTLYATAQCNIHGLWMYEKEVSLS